MIAVALLALAILLIIPLFLMNRKRTKENFTTPVALKVPAGNNTDGNYFYVGKVENDKNGQLTTSNGKYMLRKPELLYDGLWGSNYLNLDNQFQKCDWKNESANYPLDSKNKNLIYGTNKYFHLPEKDMYGKKIASPPDCKWSDYMYSDKKKTYLENYNETKAFCLTKPTFEDVWGIVPQYNFQYFPKSPLA